MSLLDAENNLRVNEVDQVEAVDVLDVFCVLYSLLFLDDVVLLLFDIDLAVEPVDVAGKVSENDKASVLDDDDDDDYDDVL